jgi:hypothetical protein
LLQIKNRLPEAGSGCGKSLEFRPEGLMPVRYENSHPLVVCGNKQQLSQQQQPAGICMIRIGLIIFARVRFVKVMGGLRRFLWNLSE